MASSRRAQPQVTLTAAQKRRAQKNAEREITRRVVRDYTKAVKKGQAPFQQQAIMTAAQKAAGKKIGTADAGAAPIPVRIPRESVIHLSRMSLRPHLIAGALAAIGEAAYYAHVYLAPAVPYLIALIATLGIGAALLGVHVKAPVHSRLWIDATLITGGVWLTWCSMRGMDYTTGTVLLVADCLLAARYWPKHRHPYPTPEQARETLETIPEAWAKFVSHDRGVLRGVPLTDYERFENTDQWTIGLRRDGDTVDEAYVKLPKIAHALNKRMEDLILERHPSEPSMAILQVVTKPVIKDTVLFDFPRSGENNSTAMLGPYADGKSDAYWRVYSTDSIWGGFGVGSQGSGKSRLVEEVSVTIRSWGNTVLFYADGQGGASSPVLMKHATWAVGRDGFEEMLTAIERIADARQKFNQAYGRNGFTPSPVPVISDDPTQLCSPGPGIYVWLDEMHELVEGKWGERLATLSRKTRKVGIAFAGFSQYSDLTQFGKGGEVLRSTLLRGNGVAMKTSSRIAGQLLPGLGNLDLSKLPDQPGMGYTIASQAGGRTAPFRTRYMPTAKEKADQGLAVPAVEEWFEIFPEPELDAYSAQAAGDDFADRHRIAADRSKSIRDQVIGNTPYEPPATGTGPGTGPSGGSSGTGVMDFPTAPESPLPPEPIPPANTLTPAGLTDAQRRVWIAVAKGAPTPKDIVALTGFSERWVQAQLKDLFQGGHLTKDGQGSAVTYAIVTQPPADGEGD